MAFLAVRSENRSKGYGRVQEITELKKKYNFNQQKLNKVFLKHDIAICTDAPSRGDGVSSRKSKLSIRKDWYVSRLKAATKVYHAQRGIYISSDILFDILAFVWMITDRGQISGFEWTSFREEEYLRYLSRWMKYWW